MGRPSFAAITDADRRMLLLVGELVDAGVPIGPLSKAFLVLENGGTVREATDIYIEEEAKKRLDEALLARARAATPELSPRKRRVRRARARG